MHLYGLIIGIAIVIGLNYFEKHQSVIPKNRLYFFEIGLIICAIIGARAYHVVEQWDFYSRNPLLIPQTWNGGMAIYGGLIGGLLFAWVFVGRKSYLQLLDSIIPILPLCQAIGRLGNYVNHENPIWWPEAIGDLFIFFVINKFPKNPTAKYLIGYGIVRFITEFWRADTWVYHGYKIGQIVSVVFILIGLRLIYRERRQIPQ